ncbi:MAG: alpha/beta fold hydrolase [Alphaproteobacteria bacterium]|nr:alpha/beta fold hydrolase [Alphaproteobacteria bacterium]
MHYALSGQPNRSGMLRVSDLHQIYWEESGNPNGIPLLVLHGGPGAGSRPEYRGLFNPDKFRIIMFDQRGSGKSLPYAEIRENTTSSLISDIRTLKQYLGVTERWQVFGTSWGSALAQKYALAHQDEIGGLILNGVCFGDQPGARLLVEEGEASAQRPDAFRIYADPAFVPEALRLMAA